MRDDQKQQALDMLAIALARCEQSEFVIWYKRYEAGIEIFIYNAEIHPKPKKRSISGISNHTLRLKSSK